MYTVTFMIDIFLSQNSDINISKVFIITEYENMLIIYLFYNSCFYSNMKSCRYVFSTYVPIFLCMFLRKVLSIILISVNAMPMNSLEFHECFLV
jgi:hypothetical protein